MFFTTAADLKPTQNNKYFIFRACWSQTDQDIYIIRANDKKDAEYRIKKSPLNPHHWEYMGQTDNSILS